MYNKRALERWKRKLWQRVQIRHSRNLFIYLESIYMIKCVERIVLVRNDGTPDLMICVCMPEKNNNNNQGWWWWSLWWKIHFCPNFVDYTQEQSLFGIFCGESKKKKKNENSWMGNFIHVRNIINLLFRSHLFHRQRLFGRILTFFILPTTAY